jgi:hypothetical protein
MRRPRSRLPVRLMLLSLKFVAVLLFVVRLPRRHGRLLVENFPVVRPGMSRRTVEALLGCPPGN